MALNVWDDRISSDSQSWILARMIDKGRATLSKKNGEYIYNSPTDQHLVRFLGFDAEALLNELTSVRVVDTERENGHKRLSRPIDVWLSELAIFEISRTLC